MKKDKYKIQIGDVCSWYDCAKEAEKALEKC